MQIPLHKLKTGQNGIVVSVSGKGHVHKRILEMGITKGATVTIGKIALFGDPIEIITRGYSLSLRKEEAKYIEVELQ